ncbi:MAG TPA: helix-turn-helix domain-containing protein [Candidatus Dormibacteraeota bacterium]|nr:helix-turn-helix domain-containing protein [Candidatus Dormibacteraeota bacterium]
MTDEARGRILDQARVVLAMGGRPSVHDFATAAGVSRATFYRAFRSRDELLEALQRPAEPDSRDRILRAALEMVGERGLAALSMDELADRSGVSRATLYRLFPGKPAVFTALVHTYTPLDLVVDVLEDREDEAPDAVMPDVAQAIYRTVYAGGEDRTGLMRALFAEVTTLAPDTEGATREAMVNVVGTMAAYMVAQMAAGRLRQMHPLLAMQSFIGPIFFHLMTRKAAEQVLGVEIDGEQAVRELADAWLRAMRPTTTDEER